MPLDFSSSASQAEAYEVCPDACDRVMEAQDAYVKALAYFTSLLKENRFCASAIEIEGMLEGLGEHLNEEVSSSLEELADHGYSMSALPDDWKALCARASEEVYDSMRIRPDYTNELTKVLAAITFASQARNGAAQ